MKRHSGRSRAHAHTQAVVTLFGTFAQLDINKEKRANVTETISDLGSFKYTHTEFGQIR